MMDANRSVGSKTAYYQFTNGLADISQRAPLDPDHTGQNAPNLSKEAKEKLARQAEWERLIQDRYATDCTCRFEERLKDRVNRYYTNRDGTADLWKGSGPYKYGIPIRRDTQKLLCRVPEPKFTTFAMIGTVTSIVTLLFTIIGNLWTLINLSATDRPLFTLLGLDVSPNLFLWVVFALKENMFVTPLLLRLLFHALAIPFSPFHLVYMIVKDRVKTAQFLRMRRAVVDRILKPVTDDLDKLLKSMCKALSNVRGVGKLLKCLRDRQCNPSLRDLDLILLSLSNLIFSTTVLLVGAEHDGAAIPPSSMYTLPINLFLLLKCFVQQRIILRQVYLSLKDVNENRLSKFELALLLTRYSEILLADEPQYNFVQHFLGGRPIEPDVAPQPELEARNPYRLLRSMPPLPEELAREFGHDMMGEYRPAGVDEARNPLEGYKGDALPYNRGLGGLVSGKGVYFEG